MKTSKLLLALGGLAVVVVLFQNFSLVTSSRSAAKPQRNVVFILADDMRYRDLQYLEKLRTLMKRKGKIFKNFYATSSLCCPSRATILRSQFPHSTQILTNGGKKGGFYRFKELNNEASTIGTWFTDSGFETAFIGKYLNQYGKPEPDFAFDPTYVPPGWQHWFGLEGRVYEPYTYSLNEDHVVKEYGNSDADYQTDKLASIAVNFIKNRKKPFFLYLAPTAPHTPARAARRHAQEMASGLRPRPISERSPSYNEADVTDKTNWVKDLPPISPEADAKIEGLFQDRIGSLYAVEDMVEQVFKALADEGILDDTYVVFTSDNGYHLGEHRIQSGKLTFYEDAIHLPLLVRGPGIDFSTTNTDLLTTTDLALTFMDLAGATGPIPDFVEGRSFTDSIFSTNANPRKKIFLEQWPAYQGSETDSPVRNDEGVAVRTAKYKYVEWKKESAKEFYDLSNDPFEMNNCLMVPCSISPAQINQLATSFSSDLAKFKVCHGPDCYKLETEDDL